MNSGNLTAVDPERLSAKLAGGPKGPCLMLTSRRLLACVSLALSAIACSSEGDGAGAASPSGSSSGGTTGGGGTENGAGGKTQNLTVNWSVIGANGSPEQCPAGFTSLKVVMSAVSASGTRNGDDRAQVFDCNAKSATLKVQTSGDEANELMPDGSIKRYGAQALTGRFTVTLVLTDSAGSANHKATLSQDVDLGSGDKALSFEVTPSASPLSMAWGFRAQGSQESLPSCAAAGVAQVRVKVKRTTLLDGTPDPAPIEVSQVHPCDFEYSEGLANEDCVGCQGIAVSKALPFGTYATSLEALAAGGQVVGTLPYDPNGTVRVDRESLVFSSTTGGNPSRTYVGVASRSHSKVDIDAK